MQQNLSKPELWKMKMVFRSLEWITSYNYTSNLDIQDYLFSITYELYQQYFLDIEDFAKRKFEYYPREVGYISDIIESGKYGEEHNEYNKESLLRKIKKRKLILKKGFNAYREDLIVLGNRKYMNVLDQIAEKLDVDWLEFSGSMKIKKVSNDNNILLHFKWGNKNEFVIINKQYTGYGNMPSLRILEPFYHSLFDKYQSCAQVVFHTKDKRSFNKT